MSKQAQLGCWLLVIGMLLLTWLNYFGRIRYEREVWTKFDLLAQELEQASDNEHLIRRHGETLKAFKHRLQDTRPDVHFEEDWLDADDWTARDLDSWDFATPQPRLSWRSQPYP